MAIRQLRYVNDPILRKKSREVTKIDDRIKTLLNDMAETMYENEGVGLAAPQVGILRKVIVIDIGEGILKLINPEIIEKEGESLDIEGCLSVPNRAGKVLRPERVKVKYLDIDGKEKIIEGTGLLARALCHEIDHLNGVLFIDKVVEEVED
ncbi:peptide deformylase [Anaerosalibacter bizertensis]|uniref:Peptide deformylase n=1 Tax=Anaerosalibacter bizertensis TaxID=932217 RepID=A0A9Q4FKX5_9FIRM|nr:peptide deformylase [Anaerosalibacter bizertensis]MBV1816608.1 peptide deformylase [Bacteroidales bacterium MSK.15.36]HHV27178.1 peptide deformylase [Tissierellia bacterium]MCB5558588.1 peptide deformylase [Anaerosalibacter bizertensis]MCG4563995.1 peptide deformylase [Anaerosalibacter bizertensis]MCG4581771.1 peptide deformylase [Anaerosalibacter bizertensis]